MEELLLRRRRRSRRGDEALLGEVVEKVAIGAAIAVQIE
jgi:hypothetical protein